MSLPEFPETAGGFKTMSLLEFRKICRAIRSGGGLKVLRFYLMGEPLLNPELPEMIAIACKMKIAERTELTSNGSLLNEEKSRALIDSGLDYLRISITSVDQARHRRLTQTNVRIERICDNLARFRRLRDSLGRKKPFLYVKMLDSMSASENARFLKLYQPVADEAAIEEPMEWNSYGEADLLKATYDKKCPVDPKKLYRYNRTICPLPFYTLGVSANGDVTVCCVDWNKATKIGNAFETELKSLWSGNNLRNLYSLHLSGNRQKNRSCANCRFLHTAPDNLDHMPEPLIRRLLRGGNK